MVPPRANGTSMGTEGGERPEGMLAQGIHSTPHQMPVVQLSGQPQQSGRPCAHLQLVGCQDDAGVVVGWCQDDAKDMSG